MREGQEMAADKLRDEERLGLELDHLYRFAGTVGTNLNVETLITDTLGPLLAMAKAEKVVVALVEGDESENSTIRQIGWAEPLEMKSLRQAIAMLGNEAAGYTGAADLPASLFQVFSETEGVWALVPLFAYGQQLGLLILSRANEPFSVATLKLLNTAGRQLALAVENSRLFADLQMSYRQLMNAQEEFIKSERLAALGGLAATMAHEIRNPLATIFSALSQIRKHTEMSGDSATLLEIAEEEALRLNRMVGGLLEFARPKIPRFEDVRPADVVTEVMKATLNKEELPRGIELEMVPGAENLMAKLDPELLKRALQNLMTNALAAVESGKGKITVEVQKTDQEGEIIITVSDNGCGITADVKHSVFEPFFSTQPSGIGLGLPIVKRIVEDHKGSVEIDSEEGIGTKVKLLFGANKENDFGNS
jgi:signal transduction histidine kinase